MAGAEEAGLGSGPGALLRRYVAIALLVSGGVEAIVSSFKHLLFMSAHASAVHIGAHRSPIACLLFCACGNRRPYTIFSR